MKKLITLIGLLVSISFAQTKEISDEMFNTLPDSIKQKYNTEQQLKETQNKVEAVKDMSQSAEMIGKSIGSAMREGLGAITDETNKFAKTDVGKFTAVIIAWKVLGNDAKHFIDKVIYLAISIPFMIVFIVIWWRSFRVCLPIKVVTKDKDGTKTIRYINAEDSNEIVRDGYNDMFTYRSGRIWAHLGLLLVVGTIYFISL